MKSRKKRVITLIEVMIVIAIIGIISSVVGFNMRGSLDKAKAFKTIENIKKVYQIVHLESGTSPIETLSNVNLQDEVECAIQRFGISQITKCLTDGWNQPLHISKNESGDDIRITSTKYEEFCLTHNRPLDYPWIEEQAQKQAG